jgi:hypothetical protein
MDFEILQGKLPVIQHPSIQNSHPTIKNLKESLPFLYGDSKTSV